MHVLRSLLIAGLLLTVAASPGRSDERNILMLGDSISAAYGMSLEQGWVALLAGKLMESHPQITVINASISGETTTGAALRLPALLKQYQPAVVVIELGGNDGLRGYPVARFRNNLQQMTQQAKAAGAHVILVAMEIPPNYGPRYTAGFRESFQVVADSEGATVAPFLLEGVGTDPDLMQPDGIHPTAAAQPQLVENFLPTLLAVLNP